MRQLSEKTKQSIRDQQNKREYTMRKEAIEALIHQYGWSTAKACAMVENWWTDKTGGVPYEVLEAHNKICQEAWANACQVNNTA